MSIAEAIEIRGPMKPDSFREALHQILRPLYESDFPHVDMSRESDPRAAIDAGMTDELTRPIDG